jgi:4-hydroxy-tetrahydrodipicolinate synthase
MQGPFPFHGVFPALITPMHEDESLDLETLAEHIEAMLAAGVHGLVPLGSTGEFYALSAEERRAVVAKTIEVTRGRVPVVAGTNASSTRDVIRFSVEAQQLGADGLLLAPPYYSLPTADELFEHYRLVSNAVSVPIMLYNFPCRTGVDLDVELVERLSALDNIQAIKESTGDVDRFRALAQRLGNRLSLFCGADVIPLECFEAGAVGWVAGIANLLPSDHVRLYEEFQAGDRETARTRMRRLHPILSQIEHSGAYTQLVKSLWAAQKGRCGQLRHPLLPAPAALLREAQELLLQAVRSNS